MLVARLVERSVKTQDAKKDSNPAGLLAVEPAAVTVACEAVRWVVSTAVGLDAMTVAMMAVQSGWSTDGQRAEMTD